MDKDAIFVVTTFHLLIQLAKIQTKETKCPQFHSYQRRRDNNNNCISFHLTTVFDTLNAAATIIKLMRNFIVFANKVATLCKPFDCAEFNEQHFKMRTVAHWIANRFLHIKMILQSEDVTPFKMLLLYEKGEW